MSKVNGYEVSKLLAIVKKPHAVKHATFLNCCTFTNAKTTGHVKLWIQIDISTHAQFKCQIQDFSRINQKLQLIHTAVEHVEAHQVFFDLDFFHFHGVWPHELIFFRQFSLVTQIEIFHFHLKVISFFHFFY